MKTLGNIVWFLLAGLWSWLAWSIAGFLLCLTIIGIPFGLQCFKIAQFGLFPFGREIDLSSATGCGSFLWNILWFLFFGWELALLHLTSAFFLCISIVGIPFAFPCLKLAVLSLMPFGARIR